MNNTSTLIIFEDFLREHFARKESELALTAPRLLASMRYSVFSGGKRFRPQVGYLVAEALGCSAERITPFCVAVELVHTYSLIHDDLPCMDDDDTRRGQPTNHRVYGEDMALLSGDALLTEAFAIISEHYAHVPDVGLTLVKLLSQAAGMHGMVAGQTMDMHLISQTRLGGVSNQPAIWTEKDYKKMHELKTGALIKLMAEGVCEIARASKQDKIHLIKCGELLGLAFQVADDLLDYEPQNLESSGFPKLLGLQETQLLLDVTTAQALDELKNLGAPAEPLRKLIEFNRTRQK